MKINVEFTLHEIYLFQVLRILLLDTEYLRLCYCAFLQKTMIVQGNDKLVLLFTTYLFLGNISKKMSQLQSTHIMEN